MKKIKGNEIIKMAVAAILSIGLFSAAFVVVNNLAFAAATNKAESIPPTAKTATIADADATVNKTNVALPAAAAVNGSAAVGASTAAVANSPATAANSPAAAINSPAATADSSAAAPDKTNSALPATAATNSPAAAANSSAAAPDKTNSALPAAAAGASPAMEAMPPEVEEYKKPEITVYQQHNEWFTASANALSPEEAAEIGARYIWDVLGESIDGKTVEMYYSAHPSHTRAYWHGSVAETRENLDVTDRENYDVQFWFTICAVSGERIDISNSRRADAGAMTNEEYKALWNEINKLSSDETDELVRLRDEYPPPERLREYAQMAEDFAARHFNNTEVVDVRLNEHNYFGDFALDENGNIIIAPNWSIWFTVTDSVGREADIGVNMNTGELLHLLSQHNDIVPGYSYEGAPGVG